MAKKFKDAERFSKGSAVRHKERQHDLAGEVERESPKCSMDCGRSIDEQCIYQGRKFCRLCAHNMTHGWMLGIDCIPCPVFDDKTKELIPYGVYPNIDWS